MRRAAKACKGNNAVSVNIIVPVANIGSVGGKIGCTAIMPNECKRRSINTVDIRTFKGVIIFTRLPAVAPECGYAETTASRSQTPDSSPTRDAKPASRRCYRRIVPHQRVLRCTRSGSGQVRDASPCRERRPSDYRGSGRIWFLAAIVLSGSVCLRRERLGWSCATQAWTQGSAQTDQQDYRLPSPDSSGRSVAGFSGSGQPGRQALRCGSPSTNDRTRVGASSKKTVEVGLSSQQGKDFVERYEQLRHDALSLRAGQTAPAGLALLLRQGMSAWMHASSPYAPASDADTRTPPAVAPRVSLDIQCEITNILAGMILSQQQEVL